MKKIILILLALMVGITNTGCWNYNEIDKMAIVAGFAIDRPYDDKYHLTIELINPHSGQKETKITSEIIQSDGDTVFDAVNNAIERVGRKLFWGHAKIVILSQDIAKSDVIKVLDWLSRDSETRQDMDIVISYDKTAGDIFKDKKKLNEILSLEISDMLKSYQKISKYQEVDINEFTRNLESDGKNAVTPVIKTVKSGDDPVPEVNGMAVFKKGKMVGYLTGEDSKIYLIVCNKIKQGTFVFKNVNNTNISVALELFTNNTKVKPKVTNGKLSFDIDIEPDMGIAGVAGTYDVISDKNREKFVRETENKMKKQVEDFIKKTQKQYKCDIFGFGEMVEKKYPKEWNESLKKRWLDIYSNLSVNVKVKIDIRGSALESKPLKVGI